MNEAAFPVPGPHIGLNNELMYASTGMTLRDYFAAAALQGLLSGNDAMPITWLESYAADAYAVAGAMMKARES